MLPQPHLGDAEGFVILFHMCSNSVNKIQCFNVRQASFATILFLFSLHKQIRPVMFSYSFYISDINSKLRSLLHPSRGVQDVSLQLLFKVLFCFLHHLIAGLVVLLDADDIFFDHIFIILITQLCTHKLL